MRIEPIPNIWYVQCFEKKICVPYGSRHLLISDKYNWRSFVFFLFFCYYFFLLTKINYLPFFSVWVCVFFTSGSHSLKCIFNGHCCWSFSVSLLIIVWFYSLNFVFIMPHGWICFSSLSMALQRNWIHRGRDRDWLIH